MDNYSGKNFLSKLEYKSQDKVDLSLILSQNLRTVIGTSISLPYWTLAKIF